MVVHSKLISKAVLYKVSMLTSAIIISIKKNSRVSGGCRAVAPFLS